MPSTAPRLRHAPSLVKSLRNLPARSAHATPEPPRLAQDLPARVAGSVAQALAGDVPARAQARRHAGVRPQVRPRLPVRAGVSPARVGGVRPPRDHPAGGGPRAAGTWRR